MAQQTLKVDLSKTFRPVTHCASGSLYGLTETLPVDIATLVAPLNPNVFANPAQSGAGKQQPIGDALKVSERLQNTTGKVQVRLADVLPGWPYKWPGQQSFLNTCTQVINAKKASGRTNYDGYEIWNEPQGTWQSQNGDFNTTCWKPTFDLIRKLDPTARIIGPSLAYYSNSYMRSFLTYCKANNCVPDVICWHQWGAGGFPAAYNQYRALEKELGISPRPITINEYSSKTSDPNEGCPGYSVPLISKFERYGVESACISWWFTNLPGRLGSLLTSNNQKGGGWHLYKWYGDMTGQMVQVTPPNDNSDGLDGFACVDASKKYASVCIGGNFTGNANVNIGGIPSFFGSSVKVKIEYVPWANKDTPVAGTTLISNSVFNVNNGSITVPVNITNILYAYRIYLEPSTSTPTVSISSPTKDTLVANPSTVKIRASISDPTAIKSLSFFVNGVQLGNTLTTAPFTTDLKITAAGVYTVTAKITDKNNNVINSVARVVRTAVTQTGYNYQSHSIPGTIQFEEYDLGGNGISYLDNTPGSAVTPIVNFRTDEDVDIENCTDDGGGYNVGYATVGEWLEYTVNVAKAGLYNVDFRVACNGDSRTLALSLDGASLASVIAIPNTTGWQIWKNVSIKNLQLSAGEHVLRVTTGGADYVNLNYMVFTPVAVPPTITLTAPLNQSVYESGNSIVMSANASDADGNIVGVSFFANGALLTTNNTAPFSYTWKGMAAGTYTIYAEAFDTDDLSTTSTPVTIQVAKPVFQIGSAPLIDGTVEALWNNVTAEPITHLLSGTVSSAADLSGNWKSAWDATNLYVLVQVTDDVKRNDGGTDVYNDDNVEIYVDMYNSKATTYGANDAQYTFRWNDVTAAYEINGHSVAGITKAISNTPTGYVLEVSIPWATMGGAAAVNGLHGFDVMINDDDDGGDRDAKMAWAGKTDDTYSNPSLMGTIVLKGLNCTVPVATITAVGSTTFCAGGSVTLNASTANGNTYVWKNGTAVIAGATTSSYVAKTAGAYTVQITNSGGCSAASTATTVTVNALPIISEFAQIDGGTWNEGATATICPGSTIVLGPQPTLNTGWGWTGPNGYSSTTREITLAAVAANQGGVYTATYTDGNTCKATSTFTLTVNAQPAAPTVTTPVTYCQNATATQLSATGSNLKWYTSATGGTGVITAPTPTTSATGTTNYYVSQTINTCESSRALLAVTVSTTAIAVITTSTPTTFCTGGSVVLTASAGNSYKWMNGITTIAGATAQTYTAATSGSYTVEVTKAANCKATSTVTTVTVNVLPNAPTVVTPVTYCQNGTAAQLTATGSNLKWYTAATGGTGVTTAPTPITSVTGTTNYYVSQTTNTCESSREMLAVTVNESGAATITTTTPTIFCTGGSVILTASSGNSYKWMNGGTTITAATAQTYTAATAGSYTVEVTSAGNCKATSTVTTVSVYALPTATITANGPTAIPQGGSVDLTASAGSSYKWFKGSIEVGTTQTYTATEQGVYTVEVTKNNCSATSAGTNVNMNTNVPSVITITSPTPNTTVTGAIDIAVNVTDADGSITLVEFLDGDKVIGKSTTAPYAFTWDNPSAGDHKITVRVIDSNGGITTSAPTLVTSGSTTTGVASSNTISAVVYPNPSNGMVFIDTDMDLSNASFMLVDVFGREVSVLSVATGSGAQLDVSNFKEGAYVMIIKQDNSILRKKITVIK